MQLMESVNQKNMWSLIWKRFYLPYITDELSYWIYYMSYLAIQTSNLIANINSSFEEWLKENECKRTSAKGIIYQNC